MPNGEWLPLEHWAVPRALRGETGVNVEFNLRRKDTGEQWIGSYSYAPIRDSNFRIVGSVETSRDVTERKHNEAQLDALRAEMEQLTRFEVARQTIAAIAHELNQPLNAISSYNEAARRWLLSGNSNPERLRHAIENSAMQASRAG